MVERGPFTRVLCALTACSPRPGDAAVEAFGSQDSKSNSSQGKTSALRLAQQRARRKVLGDVNGRAIQKKASGNVKTNIFNSSGKELLVPPLGCWYAYGHVRFSDEPHQLFAVRSVEGTVDIVPSDLNSDGSVKVAVEEEASSKPARPWDGRKGTAEYNKQFQAKRSPSTMLFIGRNMQKHEPMLVEAMLHCRPALPSIRPLKTRNDMTHAQLKELSEAHSDDPLPDGWQFDGRNFIDMTGQSTIYRPEIDELAKAWLEVENEEVCLHNAGVDHAKELAARVLVGDKEALEEELGLSSTIVPTRTKEDDVDWVSAIRDTNIKKAREELNDPNSLRNKLA